MVIGPVHLSLALNAALDLLQIAFRVVEMAKKASK